MPNVSKVIYGNNTIIDLTSDTITPSDVLNSKSFHDASGTLRTGSADLSTKYDTGDTAETTIDDADYFPFYDSSATAKRKSLWSNIKSVLKTYFDTLYSTVKTRGTATSGGTDLSLVNTGDMYTWNNKASDEWSSTSTVTSGTISFTGIDDTNSNGYKLYINVDDNSTEKNPTAEITSISGTGTSSMSITYSTNADSGASGKLRIIK